MKQKTQIRSSQAALVMFASTVGTVYFPLAAVIVPISGTSGWLVVLIAFMAATPWVLLSTWLGKTHKTGETVMKLKTYQRALSLILLTSFCLVGCWDLEEITSLAPLSAIGIDVGSGPDMLRISAQLSLPGASVGGAGGSATSSRLRVLTVESDSLITAFALMQSSSRRKLFFQHLNFVVFGSELAKNGLGVAIEAAQGWTTIRGSSLIFVARGSAEEVLHAHSGIGKNPGGDITDIISNVSNAPVARKMTLNKVINALSTPGSTTLTLPILDLMPLALASGDESPASGVGQGGQQFMEILMGGTALFDRDRWVAELDVRKTQTLAALVGEAKEGVSAMPNPHSRDPWRL